MGATVWVYWPGISDDQQEAAPGFWNDSKAWGEWMAEREGHPGLLEQLRALGLEPVLTCRTDGMTEGDVYWVKPADLRAAAETLRVLVLAQDPRVSAAVATYSLHANHVDPVHEELANDLASVAEIAEFAEREGVAHMTLHVGW